MEVSPEFISSVTDAVMAEVGGWRARPLEPMYPVVFFDALQVKIHEDAAAQLLAFAKYPIIMHAREQVAGVQRHAKAKPLNRRRIRFCRNKRGLVRSADEV